jgi:hypothetical protein
MKIDAGQIKEKHIAGKTKDGDPVVYVETVGGLCAFFAKQEDKIVAIGAAPHREIARFLAEKKSPGIKWEEEEMAKNEGEFFLKLRKMMFMPKQAEPVGAQDIYMIYDLQGVTMTILNKDEVALYKATFDPYVLIRSFALDKDAIFMKDFGG